MRTLNKTQIDLMEGLIKAGQNTTKQTLSRFLRQKYGKVIETKDYLCAEGNIPIALVAHMDTVFDGQLLYARDLYYDQQKNVMFCPHGAGFDDKAGIFSIIQIIKRGLRPHIVFTTDEERGALGADKLTEVDCPFEDLRYVIELDRRGAMDCVFYDCVNNTFTEYVESFGFAEAIGSFSDISVLCPHWKVAGVNLSIGYQDEHSVSEVLHVGHMLSTIDKVCEMLQQETIPSFEYIGAPSAWYKWYNLEDPAEATTVCYKCGGTFNADEVIPVKCKDLYTKSICIDCLSKSDIEFCANCGEAFEPTELTKYQICEDCWYDRAY